MGRFLAIAAFSLLALPAAAQLFEPAGVVASIGHRQPGEECAGLVYRLGAPLAAADAGRGCGAFGQTTDAQTVAMFRCDEALTANDLLDEISGTTMDHVGQSMDPASGQVNGARTTIGKADGSGFDSDMSTKVIGANVGTAMAGGSFTLEATVNLNATGGGYSEVIGGADYVAGTVMGVMFIDPTGHLYFQNHGPSGYGGIVGATALSTHAWHHLAISVALSGSNQLITLYVDGVFDGSGTTAKADTGLTGKVCVGNASFCRGGDTQLDGTLDDTKVEARAMSAAEIAADACSVGLLAH